MSGKTNIEAAKKRGYVLSKPLRIANEYYRWCGANSLPYGELGKGRKYSSIKVDLLTTEQWFSMTEEEKEIHNKQITGLIKELWECDALKAKTIFFSAGNYCYIYDLKNEYAEKYMKKMLDIALTTVGYDKWPEVD